MPERDDGGPAFPRPLANAGLLVEEGSAGMTLRDWFAGQALPGAIRAIEVDSMEQLGAAVLALGMPEDTTGYKLAARVAYDYADAMLAERAK